MRRAAFASLLVAWLLASGAQWDLLQGVAWGRMIAGYSRSMPIDDAVRLTFTPGNRCELCMKVAAARAAEEDPESPAAPTRSSGSRIDFLLAGAPEHRIVLPRRDPPAWERSEFQPPPAVRTAPPRLPPRLA